MKIIDEALHTRIEALAAKYREAILSIPGVTDVGVGYRQKNRALTEEPALVVRVARKFDLAKLPEHARLPTSIEGVPVDVQEVHQTPHLEPQQRADALLGGLAIQNVKRGGWGTLGAIVKDRATGQLLGLTNHHILFGRHFLWIGGEAGDTVVQPDSASPGSSPVGTVLRGDRSVDAAVFLIDGRRPVEMSESLLGVGGRFAGTQRARVGLRVLKSGAVTGVTYGIVSFISTLSLTVVPDPAVPAKNNEISKSGDSGAVWASYESDLRAVALHRVGEDGLGEREWAGGNVISRVVEALGIEF